MRDVIVIGSGKGGVGKSVMSILLASALADAGERILLFDGDQNLANLHVLLGITPSVLPDADMALPGASLTQVSGNLWLLPGASGAETLQGLGAADRSRLHHRQLRFAEGFDRVIVDAGAGLDSIMRAVTMEASRLVVLTVNEPAALTDAYAVIKLVSRQAPSLPLDILVNQTNDPADGRLAYERLATACERFLRRGIRHLGTVPHDPAIRNAVRQPARFLALVRQGLAANQIRATIVGRLMSRQAGSVA
jgi:flagellar biosynthesis protein FlhG